MKKRIRALLHGVAEFARDIVGTVLVLLTLALAFLLFSQTGAALALRVAGDLTGMIGAESVEGRLWGRLRLTGFRFENEGLLLEIDRVALDWSPASLLAARLQLDLVDAGTATVTVRPTPDEEDDGSPPLTRLPFDLLVGAARLQRLDLRLPESEPIVLDAIELSADWRAARIALRRLAATTPWVGAVVAGGDAELREDGIDIDELRAESFVQARLQGRLGYSTPSDLKLQWTQLQWPPQGEPQLRSARGELHWTGLFDDYRYALQGELAAAGLDTSLRARGGGSLSRIAADELQAKLLDGELRARAVADWSGEALRLDADGQVKDLNPVKLHPELPGRVSGDFRSRTVLRGDRPAVEFSAELRDSTLRGYPLTLEARGRYADDAVDLEHAVLASGGSRLRTQGRVYPRLDLKAGLDSPDLAALWPELHGRAQLTMAAKGDYARPAVRAQGTVEALRYRDIRLARATLDADVDLARRLDLRLEARQLEVGQDIRHLRLVVDGSPADHRLDATADTVDGAVSLALRGRLDLDRPGWDGELTESRLAPLRLPAWSLEEAAPLALGPGVDLQPACWRSADGARACVRVQIAGARQRYALRLEHFELASLAPLLPKDLSLSGVVDGVASVAFDDGGLRELSAELATGGGELRQAALPPLQWQAGSLSAEETPQGLIATLELPFAGGRLEGDARLAPGPDLMQRALSGSARIALPDIAFLKSFSAELQSVQGRIDGEFSFAGTLAGPQPQGRIDLTEGALRLATPGTELRELTASVIAEGAQPLRVTARAASGEGELYVGGEVDPWSDPLRLELKLSGYNVPAVRTAEANVWVSPNLAVGLAQRQLRVTGTVEVPRAEVLPKTLDAGVGPSSDQVIVRSDEDVREPAIAIFADIGLLLGKEVRFEGFGLKTRLAGRLQLREEPGTPTSGRGEINLLEGRYKAYGQDLTIETGRLLFNGGPVTSPAVELRATRQPRDDITVGVFVRGTLEEPLLSLFSTPSMSQQQQLSWLILGRDLDEATGSEDQQMLAGAALSMGLAGGEWLAQRFGGGLGLDQITLGAKPGQSAEQAQFTVGKYLRPGLFISYGIGLFQPGHTFKLEYDIGKGFKLATESGVESGGDLMYTIERAARLRERKPEEAPSAE